jgi:hypothetical protein
MFFETLLDGSKYIYIKQSFNRDDAQEYCANNYDGALCSFKTNREWNHLSDISRSSERKGNSYWTGLKRTKQNGTWYFEFSDGIVQCGCFYMHEIEDDQCGCFYMHGGTCYCSSCTESKYFICQVNKGNKIYG